jgi:CheY-like chemotaxis protein
MDDEPSRGSGETILIAEDEPALRRLLACALVDLGYEVVITQDGEEAARAFEAAAGRVRLAILDVVMPRLGGLQAYARMRNVAPRLKVVFTTGYAPEYAQLDEVVAEGGHAVLSKPFSLNELGRVVSEVLERAESSQRTSADAGA